MRNTFLSVLAGCWIGISSGGAAAYACPTDAVCETYEYDVHGRLVEVVHVKDTSGTEETVTVVYDYDDAGNRIIKDTTVT
jgi:hypothetical protein